MDNQPKWAQYAVLIQSQLQEMFEDAADNYIDIREFEDSEKFKEFLHALSTVVPAMLYNKLTNEEKDFLEYNHIANSLCFEYSDKES